MPRMTSGARMMALRTRRRFNYFLERADELPAPRAGAGKRKQNNFRLQISD
jgi:hypothetical protein